jgi:hypothetical protein
MADYHQVGLVAAFDSLFVPFRARPSHFVRGGEHPLFGNTAGIPIWPAFVASSLFATSFRLSMATYMEHNEWNQATGEAVAHSLSQLSFAFWETVCVVFVALQMVAALRWGWHIFLRKITGQTGISGANFSLALWRFFVFHTCGIAMWFALCELTISVTNKYYFGHPFTTIAEVMAPNSLWGWALFACFVFFVVRLYQSNTEILLEIYG